MSGAFVWLVWRSSKYTHTRFEQVNSDLLLTTVPASTASLGLLGFVYVRLLATLALPTLGIAIGTAVGLGSVLIAFTVIFAIGSMAAAAAVVGAASRLVVRLVALRAVRVRFYRDLLIVFGWIPLVIGAMLLQELSVSLVPLIAVFDAIPLAWFVDLALLGSIDAELGSPVRALGAIAVVAVTVPVLALLTTVFARRVWESEPTSAIGTRGSHSLLDEGVLERFIGDRLPRAVYTVARERWLIERRVPRGLLSSGYALLFMGVFGFPLVALAGSPTALLLFVAVTIGLTAGIAFGSDPIGTEYRTIPVLLTSITGRQFVSGLLLATAVTVVPMMALVIVPFGILGSIGAGQTTLIALVGMAVGVCTAAVAVAVGLGVERFAYTPIPFFFTDVSVYTEPGIRAFVRYGQILVVGVFATVPAFVGNAPPVYERLSTVGIPTVGVRMGSLLVTLVLAGVITRTAASIAIRRFRAYQIS
ncbi:putative membrane protein, predicted permease [Halapricum desulfuricans]|uniref:Putative membrane protein, predicted permease n=2 Tax=Halapricum desulfuricans TaxID=2841257 RepID=A0A897NN45_9EURY|nr:putative membrane protein, predicted permease [Halapricum desulfuricans]